MNTSPRALLDEPRTVTVRFLRPHVHVFSDDETKREWLWVDAGVCFDVGEDLADEWLDLGAVELVYDEIPGPPTIPRNGLH